MEYWQNMRGIGGKVAGIDRAEMGPHAPHLRASLTTLLGELYHPRQQWALVEKAAAEKAAGIDRAVMGPHAPHLRASSTTLLSKRRMHLRRRMPTTNYEALLLFCPVF